MYCIIDCSFFFQILFSHVNIFFHFVVSRLLLNHNNLKISGRYHHRRVLTNFKSLEELHLTNAFTEVIDSKWYLDDLKDILLAAEMTKLYKLHLEQNEIW